MTWLPLSNSRETLSGVHAYLKMRKIMTYYRDFLYWYVTKGKDRYPHISTDQESPLGTMQDSKVRFDFVEHAAMLVNHECTTRTVQSPNTEAESGPFFRNISTYYWSLVVCIRDYDTLRRQPWFDYSWWQLHPMYPRGTLRDWLFTFTCSCMHSLYSRTSYLISVDQPWAANISAPTANPRSLSMQKATIQNQTISFARFSHERWRSKYP